MITSIVRQCKFLTSWARPTSGICVFCWQIAYFWLHGPGPSRFFLPFFFFFFWPFFFLEKFSIKNWRKFLKTDPSMKFTYIHQGQCLLWPNSMNIVDTWIHHQKYIRQLDFVIICLYLAKNEPVLLYICKLPLLYS